MLSSFERTCLVPQENRTVALDYLDINRVVSVPQEDRIVVVVEKQTDSFERTVYATED